MKRVRNTKGEAREDTTNKHESESHSHGHEMSAEEFAKRVAKMMDRAVLAQECSDLVLLAEPHFLGLVNKALPKRVTAVMRRELATEWRQGSDRKLTEYLREKLA